MNYNHPELRDRLAAEYVLGTLKGKARRRFDRLLMEDSSLRREVWSWESRLTPMTEALKPEEPPKHVWRAIQQRLGHQPMLETFWQGLAFWRNLGIVSSICTVILVALVTIRPGLDPALEANYFAMFENKEEQALWLVNIDKENGQFEVRAVSIVGQANKSFELWMLPSGGKAPQSMGLLPVDGKQNLKFSKAVGLELQSATGLAVSLEPQGGSTTGAPSGPVLYQTKLIKL